MSDKILHKRSLTDGSIPTTSSLDIGEIALNIPDGKIYIHKSGSQGESIESAITSNSTSSIGVLTLSGSLILSGSTEINSGNILDISAENIFFDFDSLSFSGSADITGSLNVSGSQVHLTTDDFRIKRGDNTDIFIFDAVGGAIYFTDLTGAATSVDIVNRELVDDQGNVSINWNQRRLFDPTSLNSIDWSTRQLYKSDGSTVSIDWENGAFTGSLEGTASYALTASYAMNGGGGGSVDTSSFATTGSNIFIGNQIISGTIDFGDGSVIQSISASSGDGGGYTTLTLKPNTSVVSDQYIVLDPTTPNHIHIRAGGLIDSSSAYLYLGGEKANVVVRNLDNSFNEKYWVQINSQTGSTQNTWIFDDNGDLTVPGNITGAGNLATTGSNQFNDSQSISGSLNVSQGITGSLEGTASYALTASYAMNGGGGGGGSSPASNLFNYYNFI